MAEGTTVQADPVLTGVGEHLLTLDCVYREYTRSLERTISIVEPVQITVHLRNFTQDGEPFVRGEGPVTFTVGDTVVTSNDSATVYVLPDAEYEVFADHPAFLAHWGRIVDHRTGQLLEFRDRRDESSPVYVTSDASIDVFKIRESDVTSIPNVHTEPGGDSLPYYTIDDLRSALMSTGSMNRITTEKVTVWTARIRLEWGPGVREAIEQLFVTTGPDHISELTGGAIPSAVVSNSNQRPNLDEGGCVIEVIYANSPKHEEQISSTGAIWRGFVRVPTTSSTGEALTSFLQVIGLRGTVGDDAIDDYVDGFGKPSAFAKLALKILYGSPPKSRL